MKADRTPRKEQARSSELLDRRSRDSSSKKLQKIAKESLNAAFTSLSEDVTGSPKESVDLSSIYEIAHIGEIAESFLMAANPALSASLESLVPSDLTPSSTVTAEMDEPGHLYGTFEPGGSKIGSVEVAIAVDFLKRSRSQFLKSADVDPLSKRIMDAHALLEIVIDEFYPQPEEKDHVAELILMKTRIVLLFLWILAVAVALCLGSAIQNSSSGPLPT